MQIDELISKLKLDGAIKTKKVENAIKSVNRQDFVSEFYKKFAYMDTPLPLLEDQTISAPHIVAIMTELLDVKPGQKILEIGTGSAYQSAMILYLLKGNGTLYTIEKNKKISQIAQKNLEKQEYRNYETITGDGSNGLEKKAPFDRIIVTASAKKTPPKLLKQLRNEGILVIPVKERLLVYTKKTQKEIKKEFAGYVRFVPLIEK